MAAFSQSQISDELNKFMQNGLNGISHLHNNTDTTPKMIASACFSLGINYLMYNYDIDDTLDAINLMDDISNEFWQILVNKLPEMNQIKARQDAERN